MQYHALSLADSAGYWVTVVGYLETDVPSLQAHPKIQLLGISEFPIRRPRSKLLFLPWAVLKVCFQLVSLTVALCFRAGGPGLDLLLVQNPPGLPTLAPAWLACRLRGARLAIDWHNFGYTILGLSLGPRHPLVRMSKVWERCWAALADLHLCVTEAMRDWLAKNWAVRATVLYDRPPTKFRRLELQDRHEFLERVCRRPPTAGAAASESCASPEDDTWLWLEGGNEFTEREANGGVSLRADRPALLVSSTSYTPDEDFRILLEALRLYAQTYRAEQATAGGTELPRLVVVVTGKGP